MSFLRVPNELILLIAENLERTADLNSLCQTNHHLASLLAPLLQSFATNSAYGLVALHWGAATGNVALVRLVMEKGAGIIVRDTDAARTILHIAPNECDEEVVNLIMSKGARIIVLEEGGSEASSLHVAIVRQQMAVLKFLLENGAPADAQNRFGLTTLHFAAEFMDDAPIELLVANGADLEAECNDDLMYRVGQRALHQAVEVNKKPMVKQLLRAGADINAQGMDFQTALHIAVSMDDISLVKLLLENGASPDVEDLGRETPIGLALRFEFKSIIMLLLSNAHPRFETGSGDTALHLASKWGYKPLVGRLLRNGINIDARNDSGQTALHMAVIYENYDIAKMLMLEGADPEMVDRGSDSNVLELARANGKNGRNMVQYILDFGVEDDRGMDDIIEGHYRRRCWKGKG